tara:strand:+ start:2321 stop:3142 length:822 start_codon:yes stop_codon:yes gene_type:complete
MSELNYKINYTSMIDALQMGGTAGLESLRSSRTTRGLGTKLDTEKYVKDEEDKPSLQKRILDSMDKVKKENKTMAERMKEFGVEKDPVTGELVRTDPPIKKPTEISKTSGITVDSAYETSFKLMDDLRKDYNLTTEQAAAFVGNLWYETGGFTAFQEIDPKVGRGGLGFAQWTASRRVTFEEYLRQQGNLSADDYGANYGYLKKELNSTEKKVLKTLRGQVARSGENVVDIEEATEIISDVFFRPKEETARKDRRIDAAKDILQRYKEDRSLK